MKKIPFIFIMVLSTNLVAQELASKYDNLKIKMINEVDSMPPPPFYYMNNKMKPSVLFDNKREVYFMGNKHCYLDEHISRSFAGNAYCWIGDKELFSKTISKEAKFFLDSISTKHKIDWEMVKCKKIGLKNSNEILSMDYLPKHKYYFYTFERTRDCFEKRLYKSFNGRFRISAETKMLVEYYKSDDNIFEYLRFYIVD